jgi:two-component sensor histidine kinase
VPHRIPGILYIDDDDGLRRLVQNELRRHGYQVEVATSGRDGLDKASTGAFEVIGLDHFMPGENGLDVLEQLKRLPSDPTVIYVTGSDDINIAVAALKAGAGDFVLKDVQGHFLTLLRKSIAAAVVQIQLKRAKQFAESEIRAANVRLERLAAKQATLLREMNHRVGNSLQLITSMIRLQAAATQDPDARDVLRQAAERVIAVAQVHQRLYTSDDVRHVQMKPYLAQLMAEQQIAAAERGCDLVLELEDLRLTTDQAISIGVIVSELVTNALKYAYPDTGGPIHVRLTMAAEGGCELVVEDYGVGPGNGEDVKGTGVGGRIVDAMAKSLGATCETDGGHPGTRSIVRFAPNTGDNESDDAETPV